MHSAFCARHAIDALHPANALQDPRKVDPVLYLDAQLDDREAAVTNLDVDVIDVGVLLRDRGGDDSGWVSARPAASSSMR